MGKMFNTLIMSGAISIILLLFDSNGALSVIGKLFLAPQTGWGTFFSSALTTALGGLSILGGAAIIIGSVVIKQDWLVRAGMFTVLVSWVEAPFISLWQFAGSKVLTTATCTPVGSTICSTLSNGASSAGMIVTGLIIGPMILYALWACWSYIWSPESTG